MIHFLYGHKLVWNVQSRKQIQIPVCKILTTAENKFEMRKIFHVLLKYIQESNFI